MGGARGDEAAAVTPPEESGLGPQTEVSGLARHVRFTVGADIVSLPWHVRLVPILLNSQKAVQLISRNLTKRAAISNRCLSGPSPKSRDSSQDNVVKSLSFAARTAGKFVLVGAKRVLQQYLPVGDVCPAAQSALEKLAQAALRHPCAYRW